MTISMLQIVCDARRDMPDNWWRQMFKAVLSGPCVYATRSDLQKVQFSCRSDSTIVMVFVFNDDNGNLTCSDEAAVEANQVTVSAELPPRLRDEIPEAWTTDRIELQRSLNQMQLRKVLSGGLWS